VNDVAAFRLYKTKYAATALSGDGAKENGGRWNHPGVAMVYIASYIALAQLEMLVNLRPLPPDEFEFRELSIPASCVVKRISVDELAELGFDWRSDQSHLQLQEMGADWIASAESVVMEVPSAVSPDESNLLLNPAHTDFSKIETKRTAQLEWDTRLIELSKGM
jgi:RES domain-containing protein